MRHNYLLLFTIVLTGAGLLFQSNASGPASNGNRATGAPGDGTACTTCHTGGAFGTISIDLSIKDTGGTEVTEYMPGATYDLTVTVNESMGSPSGYGFSMIGLFDSDDSNVGGWSNESSNAQLSTSAGRNYVEHDGASATNEFSVDWTAPSEGSGSVSFYIGANAVNLNGGNTEDNAALTSVSIAEMAGDTNDSIPAGISEDIVSQLGLFPNPAIGSVQLRGFDRGDAYSIWSANGELVSQDIIENTQIDVQDLPSGYYFIRKEATSAVLPFVKL